MLTNSLPVALVVPHQGDAHLFTQALAECGFRRITLFTSGKEAYEVCTRQMFPIFVTRMELPDINGIVLIQKLRLTGNYGMEPHLFVCNKVDPKLYSITAELDLDYVLVPPFSKALIAKKFKHLIDTENNLSEIELQYRDAKAAFANDLVEMSEEHIKTVLKNAPGLEKAIILAGDIAAKRNNFDLANQYYKEAMTLNPRATTAMHKLAQLMMQQGDFVQATQLLDRLATVNPYSIKLLENAGLSNFNIERYDAAKAHMQQLDAVDSGNKTAATVTAQVKIKTGDYTDLIAGLKKGLNEKEMIQFLNNAGAKLSTEHDVDGALRMYQAAVDQIEESKFLYAIHYNMGLAFRKKKLPAKAKLHFEKALRLNPEFDKAATALKDLAAQAA